MYDKCCCFIGHREICESEQLLEQLDAVIRQLIEQEEVSCFLLGSKSRFNTLCYERLSALKKEYPHIRRVYVRAEFPLIDKDYREYLQKYYEDTYYVENALGPGRYVLRNRDMIDKSSVCVFYCVQSYSPKGRRSGTKLALEYAAAHNKKIILLPDFQS